ncbi:hypothetical protein [Palaeococcus ferrophilus]|uniref:hypothetical protein n=1 Tax=Palaeococcus ferrophilus TaxID=83868 RepID=UPI00064FDD7B|nr:hypothetical protein [Palaeococcus ferrophilus]
MRVRIRVYGASVSEGELKRELRRMLKVRGTAEKLYKLLSEEELNEIEREVKKRRFSLRDFGDID